MQNSIVKKSLVIGIIFLFIGIGIQPAFANEVSIIKPSENIEDCNFQVNDNFDIVRLKSLFNRAERFISRVEIFTKLIPIFSKDNPEVIKDCEELSDEIKDLSMMVNELTTALSGQDNPIICAILEAMLNVTGKIYTVVYNILNLSYIIFHFIPIIANFIVLIHASIFSILLVIVFTIISFQVYYDCIEVPTGHRKILYHGTKELKQKMLLINNITTFENCNNFVQNFYPYSL